MTDIKNEFEFFLNFNIELNEVSRKTVKFNWEQGFRKGTGKFTAQDEEYYTIK